MRPGALQRILQLPVDERIELVQAIWDSVVADSAAVPVTLTQRRELDARLAGLKSRPSAGRPWSAVCSALLEKK